MKTDQVNGSKAMPCVPMDRKSGTIAGVVLAGGRSTRMGVNKAFLCFKGKPLIEHMRSVVASACRGGDVYISGNIQGYPCIEDEKPNVGPAAAILSVAHKIGKNHRGLLFVPVDMPNLTAEILGKLMREKDVDGACYQDHPLPLWLNTPLEKHRLCDSVRDLISTLNIVKLPVPKNSENKFINTNTPEEWKALI